MSKADGKDGTLCECGGWVDYTDLGSVFHHEHKGLPEPWGVEGKRMNGLEMKCSSCNHGGTFRGEKCTTCGVDVL